MIYSIAASDYTTSPFRARLFIPGGPHNPALVYAETAGGYKWGSCSWQWVAGGESIMTIAELDFIPVDEGLLPGLYDPRVQFMSPSLYGNFRSDALDVPGCVAPGSIACASGTMAWVVYAPKMAVVDVALMVVSS